MNFVHTNHLLPWLRRPIPFTRSRKDMGRLLREVVRVLAPSGQLLMSERIPGSALEPEHDYDDNYPGVPEFRDRIRTTLGELGMTDIAIDPVERPQTADYLFDPKRDFSAQFTRTSRIGLNIFARKPSRQGNASNP